jgi:hypothetical protein
MAWKLVFVGGISFEIGLFLMLVSISFSCLIGANSSDVPFCLHSRDNLVHSLGLYVGNNGLMLCEAAKQI